MDEGKDNKYNWSAGDYQRVYRNPEHKSDEKLNSPVVTPEETEQALKSIRGRLGLDSSMMEQSVSDHQNNEPDSHRSEEQVPQSDSPRLFPKATSWVRGGIAIAASLVIAVLAAIWMQPIEIQVPAGDQLATVLPDGSELKLNSGSSVVYARGFGRTHRTLKLNGEAYFDVKPDNLPFSVQTGSATTRVTGTRFSIQYWSVSNSQEVRLALFSGSVDFITNRDDSEIYSIESGTRIIWGEGLNTPKTIPNISEDRERIWEDGGLTFQDTPLETVILAMEKIYGISLSLESDDLANERLTLFYRSSPPVESVLEDLAQVQGLVIRKTQEGYRLIQPSRDP